MKRALLIFLSLALIFSLAACGKPAPAVIESTAEPQQSEDVLTVEREAGPPVLQTANEATALALRYYIFARLKTEEFVTADFEAMPDGAFAGMMDELVSIWETADVLASGAESITDQAVALLENEHAAQMAAVGIQPQAQFTTLAATGQNYSVSFLADNTGEPIDRQTWAENLTKQYDALRGAQRYKQLAEQLGTDTRTAVEQMALAQKIIQGVAAMEEAQAEVGAYTRSINIVEGYKTGSKVGLFIGATIATGGGSLTALAGSSMSVPAAGAVIVGGVDCIVDVGKTTSSIILGEDHQVTVDFEKAGDVIQPVSMVVGLVTMDPTSLTDEIAFIGEAMMEWCYPGKVTGIAVETTKQGNSMVMARLIEMMGQAVPDVERDLESLKLAFPKEEGTALSELIEANAVDAEAALEKLRELNAQMAASAPEGESGSGEPQETNPPEQDEGTLTGEQDEQTDPDAITRKDIAGTYSAIPTLAWLVDDAEIDEVYDEYPIVLTLDDSGSGTVNLGETSGTVSYIVDTVTYSVTQGGIAYVFEGKISRDEVVITISGDIKAYWGGFHILTYSWTATK